MRTLLAHSAIVSAATLALLAPQIAEACGCFSPPEPEPTAVDPDAFAVNQQAEQIIFEVDAAAQEITAHVMISYQGDPAAFGWLVPVPDVPVLDLSPATAFGVLDRLYGPEYRVIDEDVCPQQRYSCEYHDPCPSMGEDGGSETSGGSTGDGDTGDGDGTGGPPPGVMVEDTQTVGAYEVTTLSATTAAELAAWLSMNGYFVSPQAEPYMQPYLDAGMKFVAAKLISGAGVDDVTPLRMTFPGTQPMIPLALTAVAAEPNMAVRAYIFGDTTFHPMGHPMLDAIEGLDNPGPIGGEDNVEAAMNRTIDEAGGDAFIREYAGPLFGVAAAFDDESGCCGPTDICGAGSDGQCNCPANGWDEGDCQSEAPELLAAVDFVSDLQSRHTRVTRLTTRLSAHEMTFDPVFEADATAVSATWSSTAARRPILDGCSGAVVDQAGLDAITDQMACSFLYCGEGACVATEAGAGCECDAGFVARSYTGLDGEPSVTCVPSTSPLDFGPDAPDPCVDVDCGDGQCLAVGGFATCQCSGGAAAASLADAAVCSPVQVRFGDDAGGGSYSAPLEDIDICALPAPSCGSNGWLVERNVSRPGVECGTTPPASAFEPTAGPTCGWEEGTGTEGGAGPLPAIPGGCGCEVGSRDTRVGGVLALLGLIGWRRRR